MKFYIALFSLFFSFISLNAQKGGDPFQKDEPYPAPVSFADISDKMAAFIAIFNDENVSNLHVYASKNPIPDQAYYYKGTPVYPVFKDFLPSKLSNLTHIQNGQPHAISSIRGNGVELYLVRIPGEKWDNQIGIYTMNGGSLMELETLAYYDCNQARCVQQDSWLQDLNGDTLLDIITKNRTIRKNGTSKTKTTVFLMTDKGTFKKSRQTQIEEADYIMQE